MSDPLTDLRLIGFAFLFRRALDGNDNRWRKWQMKAPTNWKDSSFLWSMALTKDATPIRGKRLIESGVLPRKAFAGIEFKDILSCSELTDFLIKQGADVPLESWIRGSFNLKKEHSLGIEHLFEQVGDYSNPKDLSEQIMDIMTRDGLTLSRQKKNWGSFSGSFNTPQQTSLFHSPELLTPEQLQYGLEILYPLCKILFQREDWEQSKKEKWIGNLKIKLLQDTLIKPGETWGNSEKGQELLSFIERTQLDISIGHKTFPQNVTRNRL